MKPFARIAWDLNINFLRFCMLICMVVSLQRAEFQRYSAMPITYDSAMARAQFALIRGTEENSEERFVLLRDILDQSYGFGFIRRLVPALRDRSFNDPLKLAFQVRHHTNHHSNET
eukprot:COSAG05_NODE_15360_length_371_cov_1.702206_1_plen_115_part_10